MGGDWETTQTGINPKGDVNADGIVNLEDSILSLQICAGMNPAGVCAGYGRSGVDVDPDSRYNMLGSEIGVSEAIYSLQKSSGL